MYNYQAPGQYGGPPSFGGYPGQQPPPGMGAPGMGPPPGVGAAPGMQSPAVAQQGGFPAPFQPPPNMPNINFSAPVIRLGTSGPGRPDSAPGGFGARKDNNEPGNRRGTGLGFEGRDRDRGGHQMRDQIIALQPPSREEIARTIFVGNITEGCGGDEGMQRILGVGGGLRRWTRCMDVDAKPCTFGFAEYEDADSLGLASEIFKDLSVPKNKPTANGAKKEDDDTDEVDKSQLLVVVDENSQKYIEEWRSRGSMRDPEQAQFRIDSAKDELAGVLASLSRPAAEPVVRPAADLDGDATMQEGDTKIDAATGEIVNIPLAVEDELADIPAEMRETVAKEIASFRDRSIRRDVERLKREEEMEAAEKQRAAGSRISRLASPPPSTPSGVNGAGSRGVEGAPLGPKGFQGSQIPRDYQKGVSFVNGVGLNGGPYSYTQEEEESDASDDELERRRKAKKDAELEKLYLDQERKWLNRERSRTAAVERERQRDREEAVHAEKEKGVVAARLKGWNDDTETSCKAEEYYRDRSLWLRNRAAFRAREADFDDRDRADETREQSKVEERRNRELGMADDFLAQQADELEARLPAKEPQRFTMSLGAAAQKAHAAAAPRRTMAEVEGLLEDEEEEEAATTKRTLRPITIDASNEGAGMSEEERAEAARKLAKEIPSDKAGLWSWPIKWDFVDDAVITEQLRPFVERKIMEYLGVQEQMLVDVVEMSIKKRGSPEDLIGELEGALDEEAEVLVKKLWRMLIFFSESEKRGLSG